MITCEICGKVFREEDWGEFNIHNSVRHLHDYKGQTNYYPYTNTYTNGFGFVIFSEQELKERDDLLARLNKY